MDGGDSLRIESGVDLLDLYLSRDDGIYPDKSPTPAPSMCGCTAQSAEHLDPCVALEYHYSGFCRAPFSWVEDCPNAQPHKRPAHTPQKHKVAKPDLPRALRGDNTRQERRRQRLITWVGFTLESYLPDEAAAVMLGKDTAISLAQYDELASRIFRDYLAQGIR